MERGEHYRRPAGDTESARPSCTHAHERSPEVANLGYSGAFPDPDATRRNRMDHQPEGHSVTSLVRRAGLLVAVLATAAGLSLAAPHADAEPPQTPTHVDARG
ncbi:hypothetical protein GCM10009797_41560 [Nocardioides hwasunensis]